MLTAILIVALLGALVNIAGLAVLIVVLRKLDQARVAFTQQIDDLKQAAFDIVKALMPKI